MIFHGNHNHRVRNLDTKRFIEVMEPAILRAKTKAVLAEIAFVRASAQKLIHNRRVLISPEMGEVALDYEYHAFYNSTCCFICYR